MNTNQANRLPLPAIVERMGGKFRFSDAHGSLWYQSPLREDTDPSLHLTEVDHPRLGKIWIWKDFADEGGKVIDLVGRKYGVDVAGALRLLEDWGFGKAHLPPAPAPLLDLIQPPAAPQPAQPQPQSVLAAAQAHGTDVQRQSDKQTKAREPPTFSHVQIVPLTNRALKGYLYGRGIDFWLAKPYVQEIHYTHNAKAFFALAFPNDLGDYELRNQYYKGVYGRKAITTLHRDKLAEGGTVSIFEGFIDFLSALAWYGLKPRSTVIVLNSVEMKHEAVKMIRELKAGSVEAYPDNDEAGRKLLAYLREHLPGVSIEDKSSLYADLGYKDFNDLVKAEKAKAPRQVIGR